MLLPGRGRRRGGGHPVLRRPPPGAGRRPRFRGAFAADPVNAPLGVGNILYEQSSTTVPTGATLVLYTDGLIETPGCDIEDRLTELTTTCSALFTAAPPSLETVTDRILTALRPDAEGHDDDVTLLLAQLPAAPLALLTTTLPTVPEAVAEGRAFLSKALTSWDCREQADEALLLLSELLTNAVQHAQGPATLHVCRTADELTVEVSDGSPHLPEPRRASEDEESGRGLNLVRILAASWGVRPTDEGKTTWFTLRL
ncbi:SpoIIE family protein phosphatase [Streptomyces sp. L7]